MNETGLGSIPVREVEATFASGRTVTLAEGELVVGDGVRNIIAPDGTITQMFTAQMETLSYRVEKEVP